MREWFQAVQDRFPGATELVAAVWGRMREEPLVGVLCSIALHVGLIVLFLYVGSPGKTYSVKRGEPLFVELPEIRDQAVRGNPATHTPGPPAAPAPPAPPPPVAKADPKQSMAAADAVEKFLRQFPVIIVLFFQYPGIGQAQVRRVKPHRSFL